MSTRAHTNLALPLKVIGLAIMSLSVVLGRFSLVGTCDWKFLGPDIVVPASAPWLPTTELGLSIAHHLTSFATIFGFSVAATGLALLCLWLWWRPGRIGSALAVAALPIVSALVDLLSQGMWHSPNQVSRILLVATLALVLLGATFHERRPVAVPTPPSPRPWRMR